MMALYRLGYRLSGSLRSSSIDANISVWIPSSISSFGLLILLTSKHVLDNVQDTGASIQQLANEGKPFKTIHVLISFVIVKECTLDCTDSAYNDIYKGHNLNPLCYIHP